MGAEPKNLWIPFNKGHQQLGADTENHGFHATNDPQQIGADPKDTPRTLPGDPSDRLRGGVVEFRTHPAIGRAIPWPSTKGTRNHSLPNGHIPTMSTFPLLFTGVSVCHSLDIWWIAAALGKNIAA